MKGIIAVLILMLLVGVFLSACEVQKTGDAAPRCRWDKDCKADPLTKCDLWGDVDKYVCSGGRCLWEDYFNCDWWSEDCQEDCKGARCVTEDGTCTMNEECKDLNINKCKDNSIQIMVCSKPSPEPTWPPTPIIGTCEYVSIKDCTEYGEEQDPPVDLVCKELDLGREPNCMTAGCALPSPSPSPTATSTPSPSTTPSP